MTCATILITQNNTLKALLVLDIMGEGMYFCPPVCSFGGFKLSVLEEFCSLVC